eukprot:s365_g8.t1
MICGVLRDETRDSEGRWIGLKLLGTTIAQLRNWAVTQGSQYAFYLGQDPTPVDQRRQIEGVGYLLEARIAKEDQIEPWMNNCSPEGGVVDETRDLLEAANRFRGPPLARPPGAPLEEEEGEAEEEQQQQQQRISLAGFIPVIGWRIGNGASVEDNQPEIARVSDQAISKGSDQAPSCSEWKGFEKLSSLQPLLSPDSSRQGGGRGLQRELLTLSSVVDTLLGGDVLTALDVLCQRIKSLELLQQGAEANLAMQVELLPREQLGLTQDVEGRFAHKEFAAESKLMRELKATPQYGGKGSWHSFPKDSQTPPQTGKGKKGKSCDKSKKGGGGKKTGETPVVPVPPQT